MSYYYDTPTKDKEIQKDIIFPNTNPKNTTSIVNTLSLFPTRIDITLESPSASRHEIKHRERRQSELTALT